MCDLQNGSGFVWCETFLRGCCGGVALLWCGSIIFGCSLCCVAGLCVCGCWCVYYDDVGSALN